MTTVLFILFSAQTQAACRSVFDPNNPGYHYDARVELGTAIGISSQEAGFVGANIGMRYNFSFLAGNFGAHISVGPSVRSYLNEDVQPYLGLALTDVIYWHHCNWGIGAGFSLANASIFFMTKDSPEFGGSPVIEGWVDLSHRTTLVLHVGSFIFQDVYGSVGLSWNIRRAGDM